MDSLHAIIRHPIHLRLCFDFRAYNQTVGCTESLEDSCKSQWLSTRAIADLYSDVNIMCQGKDTSKMKIIRIYSMCEIIIQITTVFNFSIH